MQHLLHQFLRDTAAIRSEHTALIAGDRRISFAELDQQSGQLAGYLRHQGLKRGDRVALMLENGIDFVIAMFGILKAGGVFLPVNPGTKWDRLRYLLDDSASSFLIVSAALARQAVPAVSGSAYPDLPVLWVGEPPPHGDGMTAPVTLLSALAEDHVAPCDRDVGLIDQDLAAILYTSGSTGEPKGVMLTHGNLVNTTRVIAGYLENRPDDVVLCVLPLSFGYGLTQILTGALIGFTVVLEKSFAFPKETLARMVRHRVTGLPGVPTFFSALLDLKDLGTADLSSLRYITNAAAPLATAHIQRLKSILPHARIFSMYGMTECTRISYLDPSELDRHINTVGRAMANCEAYVADDRGNRLPPGTVGELVVRGANVMRGYWRRPEATARTLRPGPEGETLLFTGDLFIADAAGYLSFVARKDDVFKCRGEKVSPREVENAIYELPEIAEVAVIGVPDPADGLAVKAYVVLRDGASIDEARLRQHCRGRLESHLVPRYFELRDSLPRTDNGKIRRTDLLQMSSMQAS